MSQALAKQLKESGLISLPDNERYTNRFNIKSASSNRLYVVAQNKSNKGWECSCPGWISRRKCKHLTTLYPLLAEVANAPKAKMLNSPEDIEVSFDLDLEPKKKTKKGRK